MVSGLLVWLAGCADVDPSKSTVSSAPQARLVATPDVVFVGDNTAFDAGDSVGATFAWDFGDGGSASGGSVAHAWADAGRYTVRLTAHSTDGRTDIAYTTRVAVYEPLPSPPTHSGRLTMDGDSVYAAIADTNQIAVISRGVLAEPMEVCSEPTAVSAAHGLLAVACRMDAVQVWDTATRALLADVTLRWGARPMGVAVDPVEDAVFVTLAGTAEVVRIGVDGTTESIGAVADPRGIAVGSDALWAPSFRSAGGVGTVYRVSAEATTFVLPADPGPDSDTDARGVPNLLGAVALRPDGRALVVAGSKVNMERGLRRDGLATTHETATRAALRSLDPTTGKLLARALFDNRDLVGAVAFTPLGDQLLVAHHGSGVVDILDPTTLSRVGGWQNVGVGLDGIVSDGDAVWVLASWDRQVVAYDLRAGNEQIELARITVVAAEPLAPEILQGGRIFHDANDPRMSTDAYLSCGSCHLDGDGDGQNWDFTERGEGFRNTQALFAMPPEGPFHWSANFDELQDFEGAIRAHQAGAGFMSDADYAANSDALGTPKSGYSADLDALAAYVTSLAGVVPRSPWREADGRETEAAARGAAVFATEACADCHVGETGTDAGWVGDAPVLHDVGTLVETSGERLGEPLTGLRTAGLRGLFATAPYLHDGRALTLADALDAHGIVLAEPDRADLVEYLRQRE